jgi:hypothetical protein
MIRLHANPKALKVLEKIYSTTGFFTTIIDSDDSQILTDRHFTKWYMDPNGCWWQGDHDTKGRRDGNVVGVDKKGGITVACFKRNKPHGKSLGIWPDGTRVDGQYFKG